MAVTLKDLLEAGSHFGHQSRRWNPRMREYLFTERDGVHIFDLVKTKENLDRALEYVAEVAGRGGTVLFVGTKRQGAKIVEMAAKKAGMPYVTERWLGGTFTNFSQIQKRIALMKDLIRKREAGELKEYTKKEQVLFDREIAKLTRFFGGIADMNELPEVVFVLDVHRENTVIREATRAGVKVVAVVDSNGDPDGVDFVIPANDDAVKSIELIVNEVAEAVEKGKNKGVKEEKKGAEEKPAKKTKKKVVKTLPEVKEEPEEV